MGLGFGTKKVHVSVLLCTAAAAVAADALCKVGLRAWGLGYL